jgi:5-formyltetrahydrofolate cyclo-ligase
MIITKQEHKIRLRQFYLQKRRTITPARQREASEALFQYVANLSEDSLILSYACVNDELNTNALNQWLSCKKILVLPKVAGPSLRIFKVDDLSSQLKKNTWGVPEPDPELCEEIHPADIAVALIPGLAFDQLNHRLGYGKGFFDRFLSDLPANIETIGIGFKEQFSIELLPVLTTDVALKHVFLF